MDILDYKIIGLLQNNGRLSMKKLAEKVSLTAPAVAERVRKLENSGIIKGYRTVINNKKLGKMVKAIINSSVTFDKREELIKYVRENNSIVECHHVTGKYSMTITVICNDTSELENIIGQLQHFGNTETLIILSSPIEYKPLTFRI